MSIQGANALGRQVKGSPLPAALVIHAVIDRGTLIDRDRCIEIPLCKGRLGHVGLGDSKAIALNAGRESRQEALDNALWSGSVHWALRRREDAMGLILDGTELTDRPGSGEPEWIGAASCDQSSHHGHTQPQHPHRAKGSWPA